MDQPILQNIEQRAREIWDHIIQDLGSNNNREGADFIGRERVIVFVVAFILAVCLWFMVNLSQNYSLSVDLPVQKGMTPEGQALTKPLPQTATVNISGEGWKLINLYNNPPSVKIDVMEQEVNLYNQVRKQLSAFSEIDIQKVQPLMVTMNLEERSSKTVQVKPVWDINFESQYNFLEVPTVKPDSITISGATSLLKDIDSWPTDTLSRDYVDTDISTEIELQKDRLITLSNNKVELNGEVVQYTEGKAKVRLTTKDQPSDQNISFSPAIITVTFVVPIEEFTNIDNQHLLFEAYVDYEQVLNDTTGYVMPNIENA